MTARTRRQPSRIRRQPQAFNARIKPTTTMRCADGHEFGLDLDRAGQFYGHLPESVRCPIPTCRERVAVKGGAK